MTDQMITTKKEKEQALIMAVQIGAESTEKFDALTEELESLIDTAGGEVLVTMKQKLPALNAKSAVGSGKLEEIKQQVKIHEIDLVVSLNDLSPSMNQYLEETLNCRVIDRVQLILDIFAMRAKSREGKLQVELAQYQYLLPRIIGKGLSLSRLGGGIGTRGPGETQLETDRRHIRQRINVISQELKELEKHRKRTRYRRQEGREFNLGLVGYTNAGKSTLLRELTNAQTYVQDQLFATLDPKTRQLEIKGHDAFTITDTVGFIEDLPTELIHAFKSTLEEIRYVDLLLHVVDASHPDRLMHEEAVVTLIKELEMDHIPVLVIYNKIDQINRNHFHPTLFPNVVISALNSDDLEKVSEAIWNECIKQARPYKVLIKQEDAALIAQYRQQTLMTKLEFDPETENYIVEGYSKGNINIRK